MTKSKTVKKIGSAKTTKRTKKVKQPPADNASVTFGKTVAGWSGASDKESWAPAEEPKKGWWARFKEWFWG